MSLNYKVVSIEKGLRVPSSLRDGFSTYEVARSEVRKYIRAHYQTLPRENPPINLYGFSVRLAA